MRLKKRVFPVSSVGVFAFAAAFPILMLAAASEAGDQKRKFSVPGVFCATSAMSAIAAVTSVSGVISADDDTTNRTLTIVFDDAKTSVEKIRAALAKEGFPVSGEPEAVP